MKTREQFLDLQWSQLNHDKEYHQDIWVMPPAQRIKHMALHHAKYSAYFLNATQRGDPTKFEKTLVDAFAICLATANTLNQNVADCFSQDVENANSIIELGALLGEKLDQDHADKFWMVNEYIRYNGQLAKACESLDHLESLNFRSVIESCNINLLEIVICEASRRGLEMASGYRSRMRTIEAQSIFNSRTRSQQRSAN